jgi:beta-xylosidase
VKRSKPFLRSFSLAAFVVAGIAQTAGCSSGSTPTTDAGSDAVVRPLGDAGHPIVEASDEATTDDASLADAGIADSADVEAGDSAETAADAQADVQSPPGYLNPVLGQDFPDPFILRQGSTYFAFATNAGSSNVQAASSTDLAHWNVLGDALPRLPAWAVANAGLTWAPSILQLGPASFRMYYTARDSASGFQCVSSAAASKPAGPYVDSSTSAFVCQVSGAQSLCGSIDPSAFVDTDGTAYLVWKSDENASACAKPPRLWSAPLSAEGTVLTGPITQLLINDKTWQDGIIEAPSMTLVGGIYYLLYSANNYASAAYAMGYATCLSPSGPCENVSVAGPAIASGGTALGPGGGSFFDDAQGAHWLVYHGWTAPETTYSGGGMRSLRIDRLLYDGGVLSLAGPTTTRQPL